MKVHEWQFKLYEASTEGKRLRKPEHYEVARKVMAHIKAMRENKASFGPKMTMPNFGYVAWEQQKYGYVESDSKGNVCKTAGCFAGWTFLLDKKDVFSKLQPDEIFELDITDVHEVATQKLGLTQEEAGVLFWGDNTFEDLEEILERIYGEKI